MVFLDGDDALRGYLERTRPPEPKRSTVPSGASRCLRRWFEGAPDEDVFFVLALLERYGPQKPETLASVFAEAGAEGAEAVAALEADAVGLPELCEAARSPNLLVAVVATRAHARRHALLREFRAADGAGAPGVDAAALSGVLRRALGLDFGPKLAGAIVRRLGRHPRRLRLEELMFALEARLVVLGGQSTHESPWADAGVPDGATLPKKEGSETHVATAGEWRGAVSGTQSWTGPVIPPVSHWPRAPLTLRGWRRTHARVAPSR